MQLRARVQLDRARARQVHLRAQLLRRAPEDRAWRDQRRRHWLRGVGMEGQGGEGRRLHRPAHREQLRRRDLHLRRRLQHRWKGDARGEEFQHQVPPAWGAHPQHCARRGVHPGGLRRPLLAFDLPRRDRQQGRRRNIHLRPEGQVPMRDGLHDHRRPRRRHKLRGRVPRDRELRDGAPTVLPHRVRGLLVGGGLHFRLGPQVRRARHLHVPRRALRRRHPHQRDDLPVDMRRRRDDVQPVRQVQARRV
mmetsp:Transcript_25966/g.74981  ORF Transcript_25966/g.74981 Transcript_25966/m.74981 type:complete len:249 (+) Transcript_25966:898-1644(+)